MVSLKGDNAVPIENETAGDPARSRKQTREA